MTLALGIFGEIVDNKSVSVQGLSTGQSQVAIRSLGVSVFLSNSVQYSQHTMEEALRRVKLMRADLGGTEILTPLQTIYRGPSIPGHPLQVRVGTDLTGDRESNLRSRIHNLELHCRIVEI